MLMAKDALAAGMVDQVETYDQALSRLEAGKVQPSAMVTASIADEAPITIQIDGKVLARVTRAEMERLRLHAEEPDPPDDPPDEPAPDTEDPEAAESGLSYAHSWAEDAERLLASTAALLERTTSLAEVKRGALTGAKRDRLTACTGALRETATAIDALLTATSQSKQADPFGLMSQRLTFERGRANL
jgi:hypothetical protein